MENKTPKAPPLLPALLEMPVDQLKVDLASVDFATWVDTHITLPEGPFSYRGHEFQREMYEEHHPHTITRKCTQVGVSTFSMLKAFWAAEKKKFTVMYFFPTATAVRDFSQGRIKPMIEINPHLLRVLKNTDDVDNVGLRRIGEGSLYCRGCQKLSQVISVPADFLIFDEVDEAPPRVKDRALRRLDHSKHKWIMELSVPSIPGYGIDKEFLKSDQRNFLLKCPHCGEWNGVEDEFPECLVRKKDGEVILVCKKCRKPLDNQVGQWVPKYPDIKDCRGYHISQLLSTTVNLAKLLEDFQETKHLDDFFNDRLGMPYVDAKHRLTEEQVLACCRDYPMEEKANFCTMGVDQGDKIHVIISRFEDGHRRIIWQGVLDSFQELDLLMERFDIVACVIDALPNQHSARDFANRFLGRVFMCYYNEHQKGEYKWDVDNSLVTVNRTESLDYADSMIRSQETILPKTHYPEVQEFAEHWHNLVKKEIEDPETGAKKWTYIRVGPDHYAHADNYDNIAHSKYGRVRTLGCLGSQSRDDWSQMNR